MTHLIQVFFIDIDGCISQPFSAPDWSLVSELRALSEQSYDNPYIPRACLCTGRPAPYAEAVSQWLDIRDQAIFESGAGMLNIATQEARYHPDLPKDRRRVTDIVKHYFKQLSEQYDEIQIETAKQVGVGLTCSNDKLIKELLPKVQHFVLNNCPQLEVHYTPISIEAIWPLANKGAGIRWFCNEQSLLLEQVAFIGDSSADVSALDCVGMGFAPDNASAAAKQAASKVTEGEVTAGVLEAWQHLIQHNKSI